MPVKPSRHRRSLTPQQSEVIDCMQAISPYGCLQIVQVARALRAAEEWFTNRKEA